MKQTTQEKQLTENIRRAMWAELRDPIVCPVCETEFTPKNGRVYCTHNCYYEQVKERNRRNRYATHS